jgi:hypothetical protein
MDGSKEVARGVFGMAAAITTFPSGSPGFHIQGNMYLHIRRGLHTSSDVRIALLHDQIDDGFQYNSILLVEPTQREAIQIQNPQYNLIISIL